MNFANPIAALLGFIGMRASAPSITPLEQPSPRDRISTHKPVIAAKGFIDPRQRAGTKRIAVTFDDATFNQVKAYADAADVSFAEAARRLIERGLSSTPQAT